MNKSRADKNEMGFLCEDDKATHKKPILKRNDIKL